MTSDVRTALAAIALLLMACVLPETALAKTYRDCGFVDGTDGPCTCVIVGSEGRKREVVSRQRCGRGLTASRKRNAAPVPAIANAPPEGKARNPSAERTSRLETGTLPSTRQRVVARDKLICGINGSLVGFSARASNGDWQGFDVELCRSVAAAVLGKADKVELVPLDTTERFDALKSGRIDVLMRNTTWTLAREVEFGVEFAGVSFYDGQGFMTRQDLGFVSAQQLVGARLCVQAATTTQPNAEFYFASLGSPLKLQSFKERVDMVAAYRDGQCDAYTADRSALVADRLSLADPDAHTVLPEIISREPLGPVVKSGESQWLRIVRWTLAGLINAEEEGLSRRNFTTRAALPPGGRRLLEGAEKAGPQAGLPPDWLLNVLQQVGSYSDIFEETLGKGSPLGMERGLNALWRQGGILYAPPMW